MIGWTLAATLLAALGIAWVVRLPTRPPPSEGQARHGALVVYSPAYRVSLFGIERLHPFDIGKMDDIAQHLMDEDLLEPEDFAIPTEVPLSTLQAVHEPAYIQGLSEPEELSPEPPPVEAPGFSDGVEPAEPELE